MKTDFATHATLKCSGVFGPGMPGRLSCVTLGETKSIFGTVAQRLEQATHNRLVEGSNPSGPTNAQMVKWQTQRT